MGVKVQVTVLRSCETCVGKGVTTSPVVNVHSVSIIGGRLVTCTVTYKHTSSGYIYSDIIIQLHMVS